MGIQESIIVKVNGSSLRSCRRISIFRQKPCEFFVETFEGPLDLLLYLIKKDNFDILNIPIADITRQYLKYIELMKELKLELAAEYLLMAAILAEIKSRLLLPKQNEEQADSEEDPRAELVRRLQEYERFQRAAQELDALPRVDRDFFIAEADCPPVEIVTVKPQVSLAEILNALQNVLDRAKLFTAHMVRPEVLSIRERMTIVLDQLKSEEFIEFKHFFNVREGRMGVVVTLIAILELIKQSMIDLIQHQPFAPIYIRAKGRLWSMGWSH